MAKIVSRNTSIYVDAASLLGASLSLSGKTNTATLTFSAEAPEVTTFGDVMRGRLAGGLMDWNLSVGGFSDLAAGQLDSTLFSLLGASTRVQYGPGGSTSGCTKYIGNAVCTDYSLDTAVEGALGFSATFSNHSGSMAASIW